MKKFFRWLGFVVVGLVAMVILAIAYVHFAFEREFARQYMVAETLSVPLPTDPAEIDEGQRLAHITGCTHCHGDNLAGGPVHRHSATRALRRAEYHHDDCRK